MNQDTYIYIYDSDKCVLKYSFDFIWKFNTKEAYR